MKMNRKLHILESYSLFHPLRNHHFSNSITLENIWDFSVHWKLPNNSRKNIYDIPHKYKILATSK